MMMIQNKKHHIGKESEEIAMSKYDSINTAAELVAEVRVHGLSTNQEDLNRVADIFGHTAVEELVRLANDIGRNNEHGEPDPKGSLSSNRPATQDTFYFITTKIWNWQEVVRFWNLHTNPEHEEVIDLRKKLKNEREEHSTTKDSLKAEAKKTQVEHNRYLEELTEKREAKAEVESLKAELHDRDMEIMALKARLYDMMMKEVK